MKELINIQHELKAPKGQYNSFAKYRYRSCEDILEAVKPLLVKYECLLTLSDRVEMVGDRHYIITTATLVNSKGLKVSVESSAGEDIGKKGMDASQVSGSASSYARKIALGGLFLIDDGKDSDSLTTGAVDYAKQLRDCTTIAELQAVWKSIPVKTPYQKVKDEMKIKLSKDD
jgi:hypothetical protein